jgi:hypothetical protein
MPFTYARINSIHSVMGKASLLVAGAVAYLQRGSRPTRGGPLSTEYGLLRYTRWHPELRTCARVYRSLWSHFHGRDDAGERQENANTIPTRISDVALGKGLPLTNYLGGLP